MNETAEINQPIYTQVLSPEYEYHFFELKLGECEKKFNALGYYPIVSTVSGCVRAVLASIATAVALKSLSCMTVYSLLNKEPKDVPHPVIKHASYVCHAQLNIARGLIESIPFLGNLAVFGYDRYIGRISYLAERR